MECALPNQGIPLLLYPLAHPGGPSRDSTQICRSQVCRVSMPVPTASHAVSASSASRAARSVLLPMKVSITCSPSCCCSSPAAAAAAPAEAAVPGGGAGLPVPAPAAAGGGWLPPPLAAAPAPTPSSSLEIKGLAPAAAGASPAAAAARVEAGLRCRRLMARSVCGAGQAFIIGMRLQGLRHQGFVAMAAKSTVRKAEHVGRLLEPASAGPPLF